MDDELESSIERVRKKLGARDARSELHTRRKLHGPSYDVPTSWHDDEGTGMPEQSEEEKQRAMLAALQKGRVPDQDPLAESLHRMEGGLEGGIAPKRRRLGARLMRTLFIASAAFFLITGSIAAYLLLFSGRQISCDKVEIVLQGPASVPSGKELVLNASIRNNNIVALENAEVIFDYPGGTRSPDNSTLSLPSQREFVGTINPGEQVRTTGSALLFGKEQTQYEVLTTVTFGVTDSNATWDCEETYVVALATAPVSLAVQGLQEVSNGQELELVVTVSANSEEIVRDTRLLVEYPFGFTFLSADPKPSYENTVWNLGDIAPDATRTITIRGLVTGFGTESRTVDFSLGEASRVAEDGLNVTLQTVEHPFLLTRPFISTSVSLGGENDTEYMLESGGAVRGVLNFQNTLPDALYDVQIESMLPGVIVDKRSVRVGQGYFRSVDNTMLWTGQTSPPLAKLEPGQSGTVSFEFDTLPFSPTTSATNPFIEFAFDIRARRISDNIPVEQSITMQSKRTIKFITDVTFEPYVVFGIGPFTNTGPHPPRADETTTYTITWRLKNTTNEVENGLIEGELPVNVSWLGATSPSGEQVSFNPVTRKVTWNVGALAARTGYQVGAREVSFQVSVLPSITQIGKPAPLLSGIRFTGVDAFTGVVLERTNEDLTTRLQSDPFFPRDEGRVRE